MKIRYLVGIFFGLMGGLAFGGEKPLLEVDFRRGYWPELLRCERGKVTVDEDAAKLRPGTSLATPMFAYRPGEKVSVRVTSRCRQVRPSDADYKAGWALAVYYDAMEREIGHQDIHVLTGDREWADSNPVFTFNGNTKYFRVQLTHLGSAGTVWYKDLKISVKCEATDELIGDSGFEGPLGVDHWYFVKNQEDWDHLKTWDAGRAEPDDSIMTAGKRSLRLTGPATLVSKTFPYHGEKLVLSAWMRMKDVQRGKTDWCGAGIQFVGLGADGKHYCHHDLAINFGTRPWEYYRSAEQTFPASVKNVQVWVRFLDGAKGTAWFDEVRLQRIPAGAVRPFDAAKAEIVIDTKHPGPVIKHRVWAGIDMAYCAWLKRPDVQECLPLMKKAGFELLRVRELVNAFNLYDLDDEKGNPVYCWDQFDVVFDMLVKKYQITPIITIETTPKALDRPGSRTATWMNRYPPKDYVKWGKFIEAIFDHVVQRYGKTESEKWLWEIWNEPGFPDGYYFGTREEFLALAEQVYLAEERVEKRHGVNLMMGLTSGGDGNLDILNRLKAWNKLNLVDHYSLHYYAGTLSSILTFPEAIADINGYKKSFPELTPCPVGCTEWNCNSMGGEVTDKPWNASYVVKAVRLMLDAGLDYGTYHCMMDHPEINFGPALFLGGSQMGLFTRGTHPVPKPAYNAFVFLNELKGGKRLALASGSDPIDGLAVLLPDGTIRIVLTNYDEDLSRQPYQTSVTVTIKNPGGRKYVCTRHWAADEIHGNSYGKWVAMGKPRTDDTPAKIKLRIESRHGELPPVSLVPKGNHVQFQVEIPSPGIRFVELMPVGKK